MEPYARAYLQFLTCAAGSGPNAEAFVVRHPADAAHPRARRSRNPERAIQRAAAAAPDWSSGTRIGDALKAFNDRHGRRGMARGAVVVILSDGWERGDPELVGREMERLARLAHRIVWVNPRVGASSLLGAGRRHGGRAAVLRRARQRPQLRRRSAEVVEAIGAQVLRSGLAGHAGRRPRLTPASPEPWASATPVPGSSVAMPSGHGPSKGNTTPGWVTEDERDDGAVSTRPRPASTRAASGPPCRPIPQGGPQPAFCDLEEHNALTAHQERQRLGIGLRTATARGERAVANEAYRAVFLRVHPTGKMVLSLTTEADGREPQYAAARRRRARRPAARRQGRAGRHRPLRHRPRLQHAPLGRHAGRDRPAPPPKIRDKAQLLAGMALGAPPETLHLVERRLGRGDGSDPAEVADDRGPRAVRARHRRAAARGRGRARRAGRLPRLSRRKASGSLPRRDLHLVDDLQRPEQRRVRLDAAVGLLDRRRSRSAAVVARPRRRTRAAGSCRAASGRPRTCSASVAGRLDGGRAERRSAGASAPRRRSSARCSRLSSSPSACMPPVPSITAQRAAVGGQLDARVGVARPTVERRLPGRRPRTAGCGPPWPRRRCARCAPRACRRRGRAGTCLPGSPRAEPIMPQPRDQSTTRRRTAAMAVSSTTRSRRRRPIDDSYAAILDLERVVPCVEGGTRARADRARLRQGRDQGQDGRDVDDLHRHARGHREGRRPRTGGDDGQVARGRRPGPRQRDGDVPAARRRRRRSTPTRRSPARPRRWARASWPACSTR